MAAPLFVNPALIFAPAEDGYVGFDPGTGRLFHLNPTAALLVELCDGTRDPAGLLAVVGPLLDDAGRASCASWLESAEREGLVTDGASAARPWPAARLSAAADRLYDEGRILGAYVCRRRAAELEPDRPELWYDLGEVALLVGRRDEARDAYGRYLEARPEDAEIEQVLASLRGGPLPDRASDRCIGQIYARFASSYESLMIEDLEYQAPGHLAEAIGACLNGRAGLDVLELGCGTGLFAPSLRPLSRWLLGLDLSPQMIDRALARKIYDAAEVGEITAWLGSDRPDRFDLIAACDSLIYFGDLRQVLLPAARRLNPGGLLAFTVERSEKPPFVLTDSGRFAHHEAHVREAAAAAGLGGLRLTEALLRYEYDEPVIGLVAVLAAPG